MFYFNMSSEPFIRKIFKHSETLQEFYSEHVCTQYQDATINILLYLISRLLIYLFIDI